LHSIYNPERTA